MPKIVSATLVRPEPINPAMPRISPACRSNDTPLNTPSRRKSRTDSSNSPMGASRTGNNWLSSRPTIIEIRLSLFMLSVRDLRLDGVFKGVSFDLHAGEILGIAGLMGSGRTNVAETLFGITPSSGGQISLDGKPM